MKLISTWCRIKNELIDRNFFGFIGLRTKYTVLSETKGLKWSSARPVCGIWWCCTILPKQVLPQSKKKKKDKPWFPCPMFNRSSYLKNLWRKLKRQVMHKILIMFYHLTTMKIRIIKKFHIRRTVKIGHGNLGFIFFRDGGSSIESTHGCIIEDSITWVLTHTSCYH